MRIIKALAAAAIIACLSACGAAEKVYETSVKEDIIITEGYFMPCTNGMYLLISDTAGEIEISPDNDDNSIFNDLSVGDKIKVTHGPILETYPGRASLYTVEKLSDGSFSDIPTEKISHLEEMGWTAEASSSEHTDIFPAVIDKETDKRIRSDYAAYVSERDKKQVSPERVTGQFYFGNDNGYMILVMCPSDCSTDDEKVYSFENITDDNSTVNIILPSGEFEMLVYKDGTFTDINTAVSEKLISSDAVLTIASYMEEFYTVGDRTCVYKTE